MAEPVTVVWWTADAPLFESIVHPGPDEAFVALYPQWPRPDQRATSVAVVKRSALPTASGVAMGVIDGVSLSVWASAQPLALDTSVPAPVRVRTPPWDLMPRDRWVYVPPDTAIGRFAAGGGPWRTVFILLAASALWVNGMYLKAMNANGGDEREALLVAFGTFSAFVALVIGGLLLERRRRRADSTR